MCLWLEILGTFLFRFEFFCYYGVCLVFLFLIACECEMVFPPFFFSFSLFFALFLSSFWTSDILAWHVKMQCVHALYLFLSHIHFYHICWCLIDLFWFMFFLYFGYGLVCKFFSYFFLIFSFFLKNFFCLFVVGGGCVSLQVHGMHIHNVLKVSSLSPYPWMHDRQCAVSKRNLKNKKYQPRLH